MTQQGFRLLALCAWWLAVALFATQETLAMTAKVGQSYSLAEILPYQLAGWLLWVPLCEMLFLLVGRYTIGRQRMLRTLLMLSLGVGMCCIAKAALVVFLNQFSGFWYDSTPSLTTVLLDSIRHNFVQSWLIIGVAHAIHFYNFDKKNQLELAQLQAGLSKAQLEALAARLNPHFMFNTLNATMELIHVDPNKAETMLMGLSDLLRRSLNSKESEMVTLQEELGYINKYIDIQKIRFGEQLQFECHVDPQALNCLVPIMLLQPIVENAVTHGIAATSKQGAIVLSARMSNEVLYLSIESPLVLAAQPHEGFGIGLSASQARLELIYGDQQTLSLTQEGPERVVVTIVIISSAFLAPRDTKASFDDTIDELETVIG
jgi:two-component system, LytTR family, sensor kinase